MKRLLLALAAVGVFAATAVGTSPAIAQQSYVRISGEGSSWAQNAIDAMKVNVAQFGITVDYSGTGSSAGRTNFRNGTVDFAASDIPFQRAPEDGSEPELVEAGTYAYIPVTAGGTAFIYNLKINGQRVTNLRLSGENVAKIFTGQITTWNDPALQADNPGLALPARQIVPVVRSDGSGSTAQFTRWLIAQHGPIWQAYCERSGRAPACGSTSFYPTIDGMIAQSGDVGVTGYVTQGVAEGSIGYVNYSYALNIGFPVAKVLNAAGYYTEPTPENVAVSLLRARINTDQSDLSVYLTQILDDVYTDPDPRNYQLSSYSYFILRTATTQSFDEDKGRTLGAFAYYAMCQAQAQSASLGYSPLPINLVEASLEQIRLIPGVELQSINIQECRNPTFSADGTNLLAANAPQPQECDRQGPNQCPDGTGGARGESTPVGQAAGGGQGTGGGGTAGGTAGGSGVGAGGGGGPAVDVDGDGVVDAGTGTVDAACDPETGICGSGGGGLGSGSGGSTDVAVGATPTALSTATGWASSQTLTVLVVLLLVAVLVVPALAWVRLARSSEQVP